MLTQDRLKCLLDYNPDNGLLIWKRNNKIAGTKYGARRIRISVDNRLYYAHQLVFLYMTGELPTLEIDHINGIGLDNRWSNLRLVTHSENMKNLKRAVTNTTGITGVTISQYHPVMKWRAQIQIDGVNMALGTFDNFDAAVRCRKNAEKQFGFHKNHDREMVA